MPERTSLCPLCSSEILKNLPFEYLYLSKRFPAVKCRRCGVAFLSRKPKEAELEIMYGKSYFDGDFRCGHSGEYFGSEIHMRAGNLDTLGKIEASLGKKGKIIEIGCAGGYFLKTAMGEGWEVFGVEPSPEASRFACEELGLPVHKGTLSSAGLPDESFDAAFLGDVIEHVEFPLDDLREVRRILRPGGILAVAVPTSLDTLSRRLGMLGYSISRRKKTLFSPPYHLIEFTPRTLALFVEAAGFKVRRTIVTKMPANPRKFSGPEKVLFTLLETLNSSLTRLTGMWGDRVFLLGVRE
ncbi:MAG: class I SAM-dependent methyltransferase [Candidatus Eisenbacteria bacterium]|nr:class I SAM-dependent methyltransferase [Candidatus Eisenbacteria bacterium]